MIKVAIVAGICVRFDAISASVRDDALAFSPDEGFDTCVFTYANEYDDVPAIVVHSPADVILHPFFMDADIIVYHFGVYCDLFDAILVGNGGAPQVVRYHNITPRELLPESDWVAIDKSIRQLNNITASTWIWPVSDYNRADLIQAGYAEESRVEVFPLIAGDGRRRLRFADKSQDRVRLVFVGRFVRSKGILDLIAAVAQLRKQSKVAFELRLVGSFRFSDQDYVARVREVIDREGLGEYITLVGEVSDEALQAELAAAHSLVLPSFHEGFCKPVVEAMQYGCIPITYDAGNLRYVAGGHSILVETGNIEALGNVLRRFVNSVSRSSEGRFPLLIEASNGRMTLQAYEAGVDEVLDRYSFRRVSVELRQATRILVEQRRTKAMGNVVPTGFQRTAH